jgi:hypothetical protein
MIDGFTLQGVKETLDTGVNTKREKIPDTISAS